MATVAIIFRRDKLKKNGEAPIHFRIIKDRKISYISSSISIPETMWDEKNIRVKSKHPNSARLNSFLANKFTELQDQVFEHDTISKSLTSRQYRDKIYGKKPIDFFTFAYEALEQYRLNGQIGTYDKNKAIINKLKNYAKGRSIAFQDIDFDFLVKYEKYLRASLENKTNTINKDFKFIRKLFNDAYKAGLIEHQNIPFNNYKMRTEKTTRTYLTEAELSLIENFPVISGSRMEQHRDMFVFAAYSGGLRISDILKLQWFLFDGTHINFTIQKTGSQISIKLPTKAINIINKYKVSGTTEHDFIFPALPSDTNLNDPVELDKAISRVTSLVNKNLVFIEKKLDLQKHLSFHISRHTFATRALRKGISIDKVSKLMGHSAIKETQIYAKIVNEELDKAMEIFNE